MNHKYFYINNINPIILHFGPIKIYWYGLMYYISFLFIYHIAINKNSKIFYYNKINKKNLENLLYYGFVNTIIGGRLGYEFIYNIKLFFKNPLILFEIWKGGMSFHGGIIGAIIYILYFSKKNNYNFFRITNLIVPLIPIGLGAGRIGNFINGELWGRVTYNVPWAVIFPNSYNEDKLFILKHPKWKIIFNTYGALPRHPSQIYEFILEGIILFIILNKIKKNNNNISAIFLINYSIIRIFVEIFRQPDIQIGFFYNIFTLGQILSIPMLLSGIIILYKSNQSKKKWNNI
ncbi:prolipoprotein diacylglyceryl transferase [Candidatus Purcelliella pentastirinorum]|uniref:Phosphatidylglycerol--prolipoprotein diacylglyceryl transferase n=1 Tax=Candidatus Purcelliella pentastirinorum TaxID=472834 RepID=A0AAX3N7S7_9ENTR|nr:prolipoprotein diacylglyceryl transferase [Candidatus Purcelliella pentastirinorum]WDI78484.1 prolipoprotein diacylglyceryl transferase [Candidatus Purcelliella pentastirinorum]WDR80487.1 prolipoprotein diacylglyceryl transferase [Candidatus Purcelliella pentastirinorum]